MAINRKLKVVLSEESFQALEEYLTLIKAAPHVMGWRLWHILSKSKLETLTVYDLIDALIKTKKPKLFAEKPKDVKGNGSDWTPDEIGYLGQIGFQIPVKAYSKETYYPTQSDYYDSPISTTILVTNGCLLNGNGALADKEEVLSFNLPHTAFKLTPEDYLSYYEKRLLALLLSANADAKSKGKMGVVTVPLLGSGAFIPKEHAHKVIALFPEMLEQLLKKHHTDLQNISGVVLNNKNGNKNNPTVIGGIKFIQYPDIKTFAHPEEHHPSFKDHLLYNVMAGDPLSFPGNDAYIGSERTQEGGLSMRTDLLSRITGAIGLFFDRLFKPRDKDNYEDVCDDLEVQLELGELIVGGKDKTKEIKHSADYNPLYLDAKKDADYISTESLIFNRKPSPTAEQKIIEKKHFIYKTLKKYGVPFNPTPTNPNNTENFLDFLKIFSAASQDNVNESHKIITIILNIIKNNNLLAAQYTLSNQSKKIFQKLFSSAGNTVEDSNKFLEKIEYLTKISDKFFINEKFIQLFLDGKDETLFNSIIKNPRSKLDINTVDAINYLSQDTTNTLYTKNFIIELLKPENILERDFYAGLHKAHIKLDTKKFTINPSEKKYKKDKNGKNILDEINNSYYLAFKYAKKIEANHTEAGEINKTFVGLHNLFNFYLNMTDQKKQADYLKLLEFFADIENKNPHITKLIINENFFDFATKHSVSILIEYFSSPDPNLAKNSLENLAQLHNKLAAVNLKINLPEDKKQESNMQMSGEEKIADDETDEEDKEAKIITKTETMIKKESSEEDDDNKNEKKEEEINIQSLLIEIANEHADKSNTAKKPSILDCFIILKENKLAKSKQNTVDPSTLKNFKEYIENTPEAREFLKLIKIISNHQKNSQFNFDGKGYLWSLFNKKYSDKDDNSSSDSKDIENTTSQEKKDMVKKAKILLDISKAYHLNSDLIEAALKKEDNGKFLKILEDKKDSYKFTQAVNAIYQQELLLDTNLLEILSKDEKLCEAITILYGNNSNIKSILDQNIDSTVKVTLSNIFADIKANAENIIKIQEICQKTVSNEILFKYFLNLKETFPTTFKTILESLAKQEAPVIQGINILLTKTENTFNLSQINQLITQLSDKTRSLSAKNLAKFITKLNKYSLSISEDIFNPHYNANNKIENLLEVFALFENNNHLGLDECTVKHIFKILINNPNEIFQKDLLLLLPVDNETALSFHDENKLPSKKYTRTQSKFDTTTPLGKLIQFISSHNSTSSAQNKIIIAPITTTLSNGSSSQIEHIQRDLQEVKEYSNILQNCVIANAYGLNNNLTPDFDNAALASIFNGHNSYFSKREYIDYVLDDSNLVDFENSKLSLIRKIIDEGLLNIVINASKVKGKIQADGLKQINREIKNTSFDDSLKRWDMVYAIAHERSQSPRREWSRHGMFPCSNQRHDFVDTFYRSANNLHHLYEFSYHSIRNPKALMFGQTKFDVIQLFDREIKRLKNVVYVKGIGSSPELKRIAAQLFHDELVRLLRDPQAVKESVISQLNELEQKCLVKNNITGQYEAIDLAQFQNNNPLTDPTDFASPRKYTRINIEGNKNSKLIDFIKFKRGLTQSTIAVNYFEMKTRIRTIDYDINDKFGNRYSEEQAITFRQPASFKNQ